MSDNANIADHTNEEQPAAVQTAEAPKDAPDTPAAEAPAGEGSESEMDKALDAATSILKNAIAKMSVEDLKKNHEFMKSTVSNIEEELAKRESDEGILARVRGHFDRNWKTYATVAAAVAVGATLATLCTCGGSSDAEVQS